MKKRKHTPYPSKDQVAHITKVQEDHIRRHQRKARLEAGIVHVITEELEAVQEAERIMGLR